MVFADLEVDAQHCAVVEGTLVVAGLEVAGECHTGTLVVADLDHQTDHHRQDAC